MKVTPLMTLKMAIADMTLHWGYWVRYPYASARQDTYVLPQPSTLVGMLVSGLSRALNGLCGLRTPEVIRTDNGYLVPMVKVFLPSIRQVYFRVIEGWGFRVMDITRHFQGPYIRSENLGDASQWFAVRVTGKVYAPSMRVETAYLMDIDEFSKALSVLGCDVDPHTALVAGLLSVTRLGPVEGLVTVNSVRVADVEESSKLMSEPCPYFEVPEDYASKLSGFNEVTIARFWDWRSVEFWTDRREPTKAITYVIPLRRSYMDGGLVLPFTRCTLLRDIVTRTYLVRVDGHEYTYPKAQ